MNHDSNVLQYSPSKAMLERTIIELASSASIEVNVQDAKYLNPSRPWLHEGQKLYVSHLPGQTWEATQAMCVHARSSGFEPVPHLPVRLIDNEDSLNRILAGFVRQAHVSEILLIAGDYPQAVGPYATTSQVLTSGILGKHGLTRISVAGHPEGHPKVALDALRESEREKARLGLMAGLEVSLITQFFFEASPFIDWIHDLRDHGVKARVIGGLAGPAGLGTLFRFAMRCGVGPSIRALGTRPSSLKNLIGDHSPDRIIGELAQARNSGRSDFAGLHIFSFGGYLRTCEWLHSIATGQLRLK